MPKKSNLAQKQKRVGANRWRLLRCDLQNLRDLLVDCSKGAAVVAADSPGAEDEAAARTERGVTLGVAAG